MSRAVVELNPHFHPDGGRFLVKEYPKDKEYRRFKLSAQIVAKLGAHASWLLAGGADLQVVKERFGHGSISTTEKYLYTLPEADETALSALHQLRNRLVA
jgi:hypothetical protein